MKIYIAFDFKDKPLGVILAKNKDFATVSFQSMKLKFNAIEEIDPNHEMLKGQNVGYLLTSEEKEIGRYGSSGGYETYRVWKRGL